MAIDLPRHGHVYISPAINPTGHPTLSFTMNLTSGQAHEAYIGPPSELVDVAAFIGSSQADESQASRASFVQSADSLTPEAREAWNALEQGEQGSIKLECWYVRSSRKRHVIRPVPRIIPPSLTVS